jgi:hypothetical protein
MVEVDDKPQTAVQRTLQYVPVGRFDLRAKEDIFATIACEITGGALPNAGIIGGRWILKISGFLKPRIVASDAGTGATVATAKMLWDGEGYVELSDGRIFYWLKDRSVPEELWGFLDDRKRPLITFRINKGSDPLNEHEALVEVEESAFALPEISLLATFGWYLTKLIAEDQP